MAYQPTQPPLPDSPLLNPTPPPVTTPMWMYLIVIVAVIAIGMASLVAINISRPNNDNATLNTLIIGFIGTILTGLMALIKSVDNQSAIKFQGAEQQKIHLSINSGFRAYAEEIRAAAEAFGRKAAEDQARVVIAQDVVTEAARVAASEAAKVAAEMAVRAAMDSMQTSSVLSSPAPTPVEIVSAAPEAVVQVDTGTGRESHP